MLNGDTTKSALNVRDWFSAGAAWRLYHFDEQNQNDVCNVDINCGHPDQGTSSGRNLQPI